MEREEGGGGRGKERGISLACDRLLHSYDTGDQIIQLGDDALPLLQILPLSIHSPIFPRADHTCAADEVSIWHQHAATEIAVDYVMQDGQLLAVVGAEERRAQQRELPRNMQSRASITCVRVYTYCGDVLLFSPVLIMCMYMYMQ